MLKNDFLSKKNYIYLITYSLENLIQLIMNPVFTDNKEVLTNRLKVCLPNINSSNLKFIFTGWTAVIVDIDNEYIAKFPRDVEKLNWLLKEKNIINVLKKHILNLELPDRQLFDGDIPFFLHQKLKGEQLDNEILKTCSSSQQINFLKGVANFFFNIHCIPNGELQNLIPLTENNLDQTKILKILENEFDPQSLKLAELWLEKANKIIINPNDIKVGYFDFHGGNITVDPISKKLLGVFDFDEMSIRDFHFDFREFLLRYDKEFLIELVKQYELLSKRTLSIDKIFTYHVAWYLWEYSKMLKNKALLKNISGLDYGFHKNKLLSDMKTYLY